MDREILKRTYDDVKLLLNDATLLLSNFNNEFRPKSEIEKQISERVSEFIKTIIADSLNTANLVGEILNAADDEIELKYLLEEELKAM